MQTVKYEQKGTGASLIIFNKDGYVRTVGVGNCCTLGRKSKETSVDVALASELVSRKHGEITCETGNYYYKDLNSTNGTHINGTFLGKTAATGNIPVLLKNGDVLRIDFGDRRTSHKDAVVLVFMTGNVGKTVWEQQPLHEEIAELIVGRGQSDIHIENRMVSNNHASFFKARKGWAVMDLSSTNGVFFNGVRLERPSYLCQSDVIRIANLLFFYDGKKLIYQVENKKELEREELKIQIAERSVWQRFKKLTLLQDINLTIHNGEMILILGGSGAGKTTFMNAVMGYEKARGVIKHGDTDIYAEYEKMKYEIGFVPQQDLLRGSDTVYDTLSNAAKMKMPRNTSDAEREARITEIIELLGLEREKNSLVNKVSGGQRKRLSIAVEFIADPTLFFLDEPDSGLDGPMAENLMKNLRTIADKGKIVMVITHGPDRVAELFDKVIVLAKSIKDNCGHLAFFGTVDEAYHFFEVDSLEGVVKKINRLDEGGDGQSDYYIERYKKNCLR